MRERSGARPVRIVLVPRDAAAVSRGLAEELVVPEAHRAAQELRGREREARVPQKVMKARRDSPSAQRVEEHARRVARLVRVELVPQRAPLVRRVHQLCQLRAQSFDLIFVEHTHARQVSVLLVEPDLLLRQTILVPLRRVRAEKFRDRLMVF